MDSNDYRLEKRLSKLDPSLHRNFSDAVFAVQHILSSYEKFFPEYTDHSSMHSLTVIQFCNELLTDEVADNMNADEIYILLMSCYLHDAGMGLMIKDYERFAKMIDFGDYFKTHDYRDAPQVIRDYHNEFSGCFIRAYAPLFDIPSDDHTFAISQIARGHRKTDLFDEKEYPASLTLANGNTVCTPYLAALIRLADEIDVAAARNPILLYDVSTIKSEKQIFEFKKHNAVTDLTITDSDFILDVHTDEEDVFEGIEVLVSKMQKTLDYCVRVVHERTPYEISQKNVLINRI